MKPSFALAWPAALRPTPQRLNTLVRHLYHYGVYLLAGVVIVVSLVALGFKFWVMPNIDRFKPQVETVASRALGLPVTLDRLQAGWSGIHPQLILHRLRVAGQGGTPLDLPRVEADLSWWSLVWLEPRLARLSLTQPRLDVHRDSAGVIRVAGIAVNVASAPSPFPDWLLRQSRILVRDAEISWKDDQLAAPEVRFRQVRLQMNNFFGRHRFAVVALPSAAAGRLDLRGDLSGSTVRRPEQWSGQLYARVDDARFDTWGQWVPWAQQAVKRGHGALRFWLDLERGRVLGLTGDTRLQGVAINVSDEEALPDLAFQSLSGHVGWQRKYDRRGAVVGNTFFVERLRFAIAGATPSEPASLRVELTPDGKGGIRQVAASAGNLRLEALTALTGALPLPRRAHDLIAALNPRGRVESFSGHWGGAQDYGFKLHMRDVGMNAYAAFPGFSGLSARVEADPASGRAELQGRDMVLDLNRVFRHPLPFKRLDARASWKIADKATRVTLESADFHNADLDGEAEGTMELPAGGAPIMDITAHLSRGEATAVYRYLPHAVGQHTYEWVRQALLSGQSDDTRLVLKGDLKHFPFDKGGGEFKVAVKMVNGSLEYAQGWPRISGVNGMLVFHDKAMSLTADSGRILGARLGPVRVSIPDLHYHSDELLLIDGKATGRTQDFLDFIRQSPVNEHTGGFTERFQASGNGELALNLHMPLKRLDATNLGGVFILENNHIDLGEGLPALAQLSGRFSFSEHSVQARGVRARVFGQPASLSFESKPGGQVHAQLLGSMTAESVRTLLPAGLASRVSGGANWLADVLLGKQQNEIRIASDLIGLGLNLPSPFRKSPMQAMPLTITRLPGDLGDTVVKASYGNLAALRADLPLIGTPRIEIRLSQGVAPVPRDEGIRISGALRILDLDAWRELAQGEAGGGLALREVNLDADEIRLGGRLLHDTHVEARPSGRGWKVDLEGHELSGHLLALPEARGTRLIGNFKRLTIPDLADDATPAEDAAALSDITLNARSFVWKDHTLGELHLRMRSEAHGHAIDQASLATADGRISGKGLISSQARRPSHLDLEVDSHDVGKLLTRLGYPGAIKGGEARIAGNLTWDGGVGGFAPGKLSGDLSLNATKGQFLKVEPGVAKLLGILSLQALPRRISLDFRDVFSQGFAFDEINGQIHLERGTAYTRNLKMNGPAAQVTMSGVVDLAAESQNLRVNIRPRLEDTVAVATAIVGGPVVGIGTFVANKLLKDPIGQVATFDYSVTGTWGEPVITKVKRVREETAQPQ